VAARPDSDALCPVCALALKPEDSVSVHVGGRRTASRNTHVGCADLLRLATGATPDSPLEIHLAACASCRQRLRESPALDIINLLQEKGAEVSFHDPHVSTIADDGHTPIRGLPMHSVPLTDAVLRGSDLVVIVTDHSAIDYSRVMRESQLVLDTRGVIREDGRGKLVGLSGVVNT
jgi:UDP-N-acetyl-D-glucosamine dehydrogenase